MTARQSHWIFIFLIELPGGDTGLDDHTPEIVTDHTGAFRCDGKNLCVFAPLRENLDIVANPILTIIIGVGLLLIGFVMKRKGDKNGNAFLFTGLAIVAFAGFISLLIRLF